MVDTITTKVFRQIRKVKLNYDNDTVVPLPKTLSVLDVLVTPDAHDKINVPYLLYLEEGGETEIKTLRLIPGEAELDYRYETLRFLGSVPARKRHHPNFSTLWLVTKKKNQPPEKKAPEKKKTEPDPESVKARKAAEERAELEARLAEHES